jgi:hypothetical protein
MIDTKMIANTKKNTPFDIISQMQWYIEVTSIKNYVMQYTLLRTHIKNQ